MTAQQIVTPIFSPTLDVATAVDVVTPSRNLRCEPPRFEPSGGGMNVARVAPRLGADAIAVAPFGGDQRQIVVGQLGAEGVQVERIAVNDPIRQSFAVTEESTGLARCSKLTEAICLGIASGTATVLSDGTELCDPFAVEDLLPLVTVDS